MPGKEVDSTPQAAAVVSNQQHPQRSCHRLSPDHEHVKVKRIRACETAMISDALVNAQPCSSSQEDTLYGMLVVLGYNESLPQEDLSHHRNIYLLRKNDTPSGVRPFKQYSASSNTGKQVVHSEIAHSVSYTLSRGQSTVVEYKKDPNTDMFQIGRSSDSKIDFVLSDTVPGDKRHKIDPDLQKSTISRYACRIVVDRNHPHTASVYAAGFDKSNNIFLGERAPKWQHNDAMMDGLTTNGVQLMNPKGGTDCQAGIWREISVCGNVYGLRKTRSAMDKGKTVTEESNVLLDGSLIDLCGAVLLWRSADALTTLPTQEDIENMRKEMNASRPQCPVGLTTLVFPSKERPSSVTVTSKRPYVYLKCGHVHGYHLWNAPEADSNNKTRTCPMCMQISSYVPLSLGTEPAFYVGETRPTHAFVPCGHVCSESTVRFWARVPIPHGCDAFQAICPFCAVPLEGEDGFVKLIFSSDE